MIDPKIRALYYIFLIPSLNYKDMAAYSAFVWSLCDVQETKNKDISEITTHEVVDSLVKRL